MRTELDHLPSIQQGELDRVKQLLMGEFAEATARANQPWKKNGRILKVILFGSYARDDWVDEPENGYQSDYDLLIIVSHPDLTDIADYWYVAEDKILRDTAIARPVNIIVHTLQEVNQALSRGEYFWVDIARDGIVLESARGQTRGASDQQVHSTTIVAMPRKTHHRPLERFARYNLARKDGTRM